ncbi:hypothetical protein D9615_002209 [Tricholomella constricta]|uniref:inositol-3-phosphate synthase n=1 Tax=Tricholomella constricta TaxID=117010 RepID=A0A8H5HM14_9AGAR|nr:hypothetical protein D9615_002209 [Tricholomella constricta]
MHQHRNRSRAGTAIAVFHLHHPRNPPFTPPPPSSRAFRLHGPAPPFSASTTSCIILADARSRSTFGTSSRAFVYCACGWYAASTCERIVESPVELGRSTAEFQHQGQSRTVAAVASCHLHHPCNPLLPRLLPCAPHHPLQRSTTSCKFPTDGAQVKVVPSSPLPPSTSAIPPPRSPDSSSARPSGPSNAPPPPAARLAKRSCTAHSHARQWHGRTQTACQSCKFFNRGSSVTVSDGQFSITPTVQPYEFQTKRTVGMTGFLLFSLMMIGLGGNNGTTLAATILANHHNITWHTKEGIQQPNYIGSLLRASTVRIGMDSATGNDVHVPVSDVLPMVHLNDLVLRSWDISGLRLDKAMERAQVLDYDLQRQVAPHMALLGSPLASSYYPDFIAVNQEARADNVLPGTDKQAHLDQICADICKSKADNGLDRVIVFWTANTERYSDILPGMNNTADNVLAAIQASHAVSPSSLFAVAAILEGESFVNGTPRTRQTKLKSVLAEFLVNAGIKPLSIASYNHLGNNDGHNLSAERQFRSKEISKSSVVDDMVDANRLLYKPPSPWFIHWSNGCGHDTTLNEKDIWALSPTMQSRPIFMKFVNIHHSSLLRRLWAANSLDLLLDFLLTFVSVAFNYTGPFFLKCILDAIDLQTPTPESRARAYIYAFLAFAASMCKAQADVQHLWFGRRTSTRIRSELMAAIYDKALKRKDFSGIIDRDKDKDKGKQAEMEEATSRAFYLLSFPLFFRGAYFHCGIGLWVGREEQLFNLMAGDANRVSQTVSASYFIYGAPFEIIIAGTFLYQLLGWSAFAGFTVLLLGWPLNS